MVNEEKEILEKIIIKYLYALTTIQYPEAEDIKKRIKIWLKTHKMPNHLLYVMLSFTPEEYEYLYREFKEKMLEKRQFYVKLTANVKKLLETNEIEKLNIIPDNQKAETKESKEKQERIKEQDDKQEKTNNTEKNEKPVLFSQENYLYNKPDNKETILSFLAQISTLSGQEVYELLQRHLTYLTSKEEIEEIIAPLAGNVFVKGAIDMGYIGRKIIVFPKEVLLSYNHTLSELIMQYKQTEDPQILAILLVRLVIDAPLKNLMPDKYIYNYLEQEGRYTDLEYKVMRALKKIRIQHMLKGKL